LAARWDNPEGPTPISGTVVAINDTAPTADRWNLSLIEMQPASSAPNP
jgi:hypothetical protein